MANHLWALPWVFFLAAGPVMAQSVESNADVIDLVKAGWSAEEINARIGASTPRFRWGFEDIFEMVEHGVPDEVIRFMMIRDEFQPKPISKARLQALEEDLRNLESDFHDKRDGIAPDRAKVVLFVIEKRRADLRVLREVSVGGGPK